jgi:hypothetical protein
MDTCSRLEEPGGVGWKDVNVGRLRTTTSGKLRMAFFALKRDAASGVDALTWPTYEADLD